MIEGPSSDSTKYVNPSAIPRGTGKVISSDSPLNNATNLFNDPTIKVVDSTSISNIDDERIEDEDFVFYDNNLDMVQDGEDVIPDNLAKTGLSHLQPPLSLSISQDSFQIESNSSTNGDGTITFMATLAFEDIAGATGYDYVINAGA